MLIANPQKMDSIENAFMKIGEMPRVERPHPVQSVCVCVCATVACTSLCAASPSRLGRQQADIVQMHPNRDLWWELPLKRVQRQAHPQVMRYVF